MRTPIWKGELPFPPSVNALFGQRSNQKRFKSKQYKAWLANCPELVLAPGGVIDYPCHIHLTFDMPDRRKRDLSNYIKAVEDYLVSQCVVEDDNHKIISTLTITFGCYNKEEPKVRITIWKDTIMEEI